MIPDEAVEAAARATREVCETYDPGGWADDGRFSEWATKILEAAAPHMNRTLATLEELDALPSGSVVLDAGEGVFEKPFTDPRWWFEMGSTDRVEIEIIRLPATVLHEP